MYYQGKENNGSEYQDLIPVLSKESENSQKLNNLSWIDINQNIQNQTLLKLSKNSFDVTLFGYSNIYVSVSGLNSFSSSGDRLFYFTYGTIIKLTLDLSSYSFDILTKLMDTPIQADSGVTGNKKEIGVASIWNKQVKINQRQIENINTNGYNPNFSIDLYKYNTWATSKDTITITNTCTSSELAKPNTLPYSNNGQPIYHVPILGKGFK